MQPVTLVLSLAALVAIAVARPQDKYTDKYDDVNVDEILTNERLQKPFIDCLLIDGYKCPRDAAELKARIPDALTDNCAKCTDKQKAGAEKVIQHFRQNKPDVWQKVQEKYDPTGEYEKRYSEIYEEKL